MLGTLSQFKPRILAVDHPAYVCHPKEKGTAAKELVLQIAGIQISRDPVLPQVDVTRREHASNPHSFPVILIVEYTLLQVRQNEDVKTGAMVIEI